MQELLLSLGYLGAFLAGFISSATLFLPTPGFLVVFLIAGLGFNPILVGVLAGTGAAIGELIGYFAGYGGRELIKTKSKRVAGMLDKVSSSFKKYRPSLILFVFAATPLPFDIVGLFCGSIKYSWKKFFIATLAGKLVKYLFIAFAGFYGIQWVQHYL